MSEHQLHKQQKGNTVCVFMIDPSSVQALRSLDDIKPLTKWGNAHIGEEGVELNLIRRSDGEDKKASITVPKGYLIQSTPDSLNVRKADGGMFLCISREGWDTGNPVRVEVSGYVRRQMRNAVAVAISLEGEGAAVEKIA